MAHGKKYQDAAKLVDHDRVYPPAEAAELVRQTSTVNFDPIDRGAPPARRRPAPRRPDGPRHGRPAARHGQGRPGRRVRPGREGPGGAPQRRRRGRRRGPGQEDRGRLDRVRRRARDARTRWAWSAGSARSSAGKGLMPNPKSGTITFDIERALKEVKGGRVEFKVDKGAIIHVAFGKGSFERRRARRQPGRADRRGQPGQAGRRQGPVPQDPHDRQHDGTRDPGRHPGRPRRGGGLRPSGRRA